MIVLLLILLGLSLGSFVNAFVWRIHEGRNWVTERSECPHCHHVLAPKDLVPVLSWLWLRGKCRYCHKPIPDSPLTELITPALFVVSYLWWPTALQGLGLFQFVLWLVFLVGFVILVVYDLRWYLLPDKVVFPLIGLAVVWAANAWFFGGHSWQIVTGSLTGVAVIAGLFLGLYVASQGKWIGFGDVKLGIVLGLLAGDVLRACLVLFLASFIGLIVAAPLVLNGKATRKSQLPFGPLLLMAAIVVQLAGTHIITWYRLMVGM